MSIVPTELVRDIADDWQETAGWFDEREGVFRFVPRFPLVRGLTYSLLIDGVESGCVEVPMPTSAATTEVLSIFPMATEVPLNLLRVYVYFSAPMSEGYAHRAVSVHRVDSGEPLKDVFLQMEPELWDRSRQRLTLLLEPGRIKRGLVPNLETGPPLSEGVPIAVAIDRSFLDAAGQPLRTPAERRYDVGPAIRALVNPLAWRLTEPRAGSWDPLVVCFDGRLDAALLTRCLTVVDATMAPLGGAPTIEEGERAWRFEPASPWQAGRYTLLVDGRLEDIAGNSVQRVFDRELSLPEHEPVDAEWVRLPFSTT